MKLMTDFIPSVKNTNIRRITLLASSAMVSLTIAALPAGAVSPTDKNASETNCQTQNCAPVLRGKKLDDRSVGRLEIGENTERESLADQGNIPFVISVDGDTVEESKSADKAQVKQADRQRKTDVELHSVDIQIKYDGLESTPLLNVSTMPVRRSFKAGEPVEFLATTNYPGFIERSEIRIFHEQDSHKTEKPLAVIPVGTNAKAGWKMPAAEDMRDFTYVLRVYDAKGRYDETVPLTLSRTEKNLAADTRVVAIAPGMGEDRTALRNIPVRGGSVTIFGRHVPSEHQVKAFGETIPVDRENAFVVQRILPPGNHDVDVSVDGMSKDSGLQFSRDINIPDNEWFYVALADLTVGKRTGDKNIESVRPGEYDSVYTKGRLAFYLKGKIKGEYLLTAAADTAEDDLDQLFRNFGSKDPRRLLRRLDPDDYYPVYGDDSTMVEDAPTNGKFYVRLERGDSHVMWGNFKTNIKGTEFMRAERALWRAGCSSFGRQHNIW